MKATNSKISTALAMLTFATLAPAGVAQDTQQRTFSFQFRTGDETVDVTVHGDDVDVLRNGEVADASRYRRQGESVDWLNAKGGTLATVTFHRWGGNVTVFPERRGRVSLGVNLNQLSDALAEHLDVQADEVLYVAQAVEGKAAAKAGVRKHDVITRIDGRAPVDQAALREVLRDKKAGDGLELEVRRGDEVQTIRVELEEEDDGATTADLFGRYEFPDAFYAAPGWRDEAAQLFADRANLFAEVMTGPIPGPWGASPKVEVEALQDDRLKIINERLERLEELLKSLTEARKKNG